MPKSNQYKASERNVAMPLVDQSTMRQIVGSRTSKPRRRSSISKAKISGELLHPPRFRLSSGRSAGFLGIRVTDADDFSTLPTYLASGDEIIVHSYESKILDVFENLSVGDNATFTVKFVNRRSVINPKDNQQICAARSAICFSIS